MPKNRQAVPSTEERRDGHHDQPTSHRDCYISLSWWDWSPTVQLATIRPDGIVAELNADGDGLHVIADGTQNDQANEPGWFVHLDEVGLKEHIRQCRRAGRRVFGWGKTTERDRTAEWDEAMSRYEEMIAANPGGEPSRTASCFNFPQCGGSHEWMTELGGKVWAVTCPPPADVVDRREEKPLILQHVTNHGWPVQPDGLDTAMCLIDGLGNPRVTSHYGHVWQHKDPVTPQMWCPGVPR